MRFILVILFLLLSSSSFAYKLVVIQTVSTEGNTFITRQGRVDGIFERKRSTFTANNTSIICEAQRVTDNFTQWKILNENTKVPFRKQDVVTYYDAKEYLWALNPEEVRRKFVKNEIFEENNYWHVYGALTQGLNESFSGVDSAEMQRGGLDMEILYEDELSRYSSLLYGLRYSREAQNFTTATVLNIRTLAMLEYRYHFDAVKNLSNARPYTGLAIGYGVSSTSADGNASAGTTTILPGLKLGLEFPMQRKGMYFMLESALETIRIQEQAFTNANISANLTNYKTALGIKYLY
jgi:hypothetical protein